MNYQELMAKARKTNRQRDESELAAGFMPASNYTPSGQLRTAMEAIRAGITTEDWNCVAEAQAMLEHLHMVVTGEKYEL